MSYILRSSKFVRYIGGLARNIVFTHSGEVNSSLIPHRSAIINTYARDYSNSPAPAENTSNSLDKWIKRLDNDVRRTGRVSMKELQEIFDEMRTFAQATSRQSLLVIRCCGNLIPEEAPEVKTKLVKEIWATLEKQGVLMDISHYNALLLVYLENEHQFSPVEFLADLKKKGIEANRVTYQRLVATYCQNGDIRGATTILEYMKEKQMPISENIFNSLIIGHSMANDMESAEGIVGVMKQAGLAPSAETFTALLCGHARQGDADGILSTLEAAVSAEVDLTDRHLLEAIFTLATNNHYKLIDLLLSKVSKRPGSNQDKKTLVLRLVMKGEDGTALKLLRHMTPVEIDGQQLPVGSFLLRQMVKCNRPFETIYKVCEELAQDGSNPRALMVATEASLTFGQPSLSLDLISAIAQTEPVCHHYYWPVLVQYGKDKNIEGIIRTLKQMLLDMKAPVSNETLREYVVQFVGGNERGVHTLRQAGIPVASSAAAIVSYHLEENNLEAASMFAEQYRSNYNLAVIRRGVLQAFRQSPNLDALVRMVKCISSSPDETAYKEAAGSILLGVAASLNSNKKETITQILQGFLDFGIGVSSKFAELLQDKLSDGELTPEISTLLGKLTQIEMQPVQPRAGRLFTSSMANSAILDELAAAEKENRPTEEIKMKLIKLYAKNGDLEKAATIKQELTDKSYKLSPDCYSSLIEAHVAKEDLSGAMTNYQELMNSYPEQKVDEMTILRFASLMVNNEKYEDAVKLFENHSGTSEDNSNRSFSYNSLCWKMLNIVAEKGLISEVNSLFEVMKKNNFLEPTNVILGPLIKVHIVNGDLKGALDKFEECCVKYQATPWKNEISCKLIQAEDAVSLQRLTDLSTQVHGEVNSLYDLVLSFVECGRIRQARKILETPGLRARYNRLSQACERYKNDGRSNHLEGLIEATKDLTFIDRADIYYHLLGSYSQTDNVNKAMDLWTQMQEEDVQPTDAFLVKLAALLKKHGHPIPFTPPNQPETPERIISITRNIQSEANIKGLRRAVYGKNVDQALQIKQKLSEGDLTLNDRSTLLNLMMNSGRLGEATRMLISWLEQGLRPNIKALSFFMNTVAKAGDINTISIIEKHIDQDLKRATSFNNRKAQCLVEAGRGEELISQMLQDIESVSTPEQIAELKSNLPKGGIFALLPEFIEKFEVMASKYKAKGLYEPVNVLWAHHFKTGNTEAADKYWKDGLCDQSQIMFQSVVKEAMKMRDVVLADRLVATLKQAPNITSLALGVAQSVIIDILVLENQIDECEKRLDDILNTTPIDVLSPVTMRRLKKTCDETGRTFKYSIPKQNESSSSSSSSSSDSESDSETRKKLSQPA